MRKHYLVRTLVFGLVVLIVLALAGCASGSNEQSVQQAVPKISASPGARAPIFPGLEGIPEDQLFDHFLGGQFTMTDQNGAQFTIKLTPGTVNSVGTNSITITPNSQTATQTYNITSNTIVRAEPGKGTIEAIVQGDKVVVITRDTSMDAVMIAKHGPAFHRQMLDSMMMGY